MNHYQEAIKNFKDKRIVVFGDLILDHYVYGDAKRLSQEAPVPVVLKRDEKYVLGGAGNVAMNLRTLDATPYPIGLRGSDYNGRLLEELFTSNGISPYGVVVDSMRRTTVKTRIIANGAQVCRIDDEETTAPSDQILATLAARISDPINTPHAIIISDYAKGVCYAGYNEIRGRQITKKTFIALDPHPRGFMYKEADLITPNRKEAAVITNHPLNEDPKTLAYWMQQKSEAKNVAVTLGEEGIYIHKDEENSQLIPTTPCNVFDVSGAGDTVIAVMTLSLISGLHLDEAAKLANIAAGIVVTKPGTTPITTEELLEAVKDL